MSDVLQRLATVLPPDRLLTRPEQLAAYESDGLTAYRDILRFLPSALRAGGIAVLELGAGQEAAVRQLAQAAGLRTRGTKADLGGVIRALVLERETAA